MSYWEGSKWQENKERQEAEKALSPKKINTIPANDPVNLSKEDLVQATKTAWAQVKTYEKYCKRLELALQKTVGDMRKIDRFDNDKSIMDIYNFVSKSLAELDTEFRDIELIIPN